DDRSRRAADDCVGMDDVRGVELGQRAHGPRRYRRPPFRAATGCAPRAPARIPAARGRSAGGGRSARPVRRERPATGGTPTARARAGASSPLPVRLVASVASPAPAFLSLRRLVQDPRAFGRDDVPLAAVEGGGLAVRLAGAAVTRVRVERPLVVR